VTSGETPTAWPADELTASLPVIALTCIDPRLNPHFPNALGLRPEQFIWLRNAGNVITSSTSSTMRSLALACAVKGGREIAIIGHTDCGVRKTGIAELTERFRALGIPREKLPQDLVGYFGIFASERQNVMRGVDFVRESPIIGPAVPVHGLLIDVITAKLEWVVNGYETLERVRSANSPAPVEEPPPAPPTTPPKLPQKSSPPPKPPSRPATFPHRGKY
jgi:carbonic anhydrase